MLKSLIALFLLSCSISAARADEIDFGYGIGAFDSAKDSNAEVKVGTLTYRTELFRGFYWQAKVGYWGDGSSDRSRHNSAYVSSGPGLLIDLNPVEIRSGWGLAAITNTDSYLGGHFPQFNGEAYVGLRDKHGAGIGVSYEHISSAGIVSPNQGRDFFILHISEKW